MKCWWNVENKQRKVVEKFSHVCKTFEDEELSWINKSNSAGECLCLLHAGCCFNMIFKWVVTGEMNSKPRSGFFHAHVDDI